jgi:hypothetical protein
MRRSSESLETAAFYEDFSVLQGCTNRYKGMHGNTVFSPARRPETGSNPVVEWRRVSPLTILNDHSRYLLALKPCLDQTYATVQSVL